MRRRFCQLFNIYPGEESAALQLTALGFLWALAISAALKFSDVLFLLHVGAEHLPVIYGISACTMIVLASFLLYAFHHFETHSVYLSIIGAAFSVYSALYICLVQGLGVDSGILWYALRIASTLFLTLFTTCYWTFIDQYYSLQDAKRLFSLFTSAIFLGIATTGAIMQLGVLEIEQVLGYVVLLLIGVGYGVSKIHRRLTPVHDENSLQESASQGELPLLQVVRMIATSPFTMALMVSNFVIYISAVVTEYNYLEAFQKHFPSLTATSGSEGEQAALALFLGRCLVGVSVSNLFIGLFIYSRLVRRFGVSGVLPITGAILVLNYSGWLTADSLFFAVVGLFVVEGTLYVIDDSNFNLLLNAVSPRLKHRVRIFIESFCEPTGMLLSAGLLTLFPVDNRLLGLLLALAMLLLALFLGLHYGRAIYLNLTENAIHFHRSVKKWLMPSGTIERRTIQAQLLKYLENHDKELYLTAAEGLLAYGEPSLLKTVLEVADRWSSCGKRELLKLLEKSSLARDSIAINALERWYQDEEGDSELSHAIQFELARMGLLHPEKGEILLKEDNLLLKGAAILSLNGSWAHLTSLQTSQNRILAAREEQRLLTSEKASEVVMGLKLLGSTGGAQDVDLLVPYLRDKRLAVARAAMHAFSALADVHSFRYLRLLIHQLMHVSDSTYRLDCLAAAVHIGGTAAVADLVTASAVLRPHEKRAVENAIGNLGLRTVPLLLTLTKNTALADSSRILAVRILSRLALPQLRANLQEVLDQEIARAYFYYGHSRTLQAPHTTVDLHILQETLTTSYRQVVDFIIHLLGEAGQIEDTELLVRSLASRHPKVRSHAVETLAKSCTHATFQRLYPLVADIPDSERMRICQRWYNASLPLEALLEQMSQSASLLERTVAAMYQKQLQLPNWRQMLQQQMHAGDRIFLHLAYELLEES